MIPRPRPRVWVVAETLLKYEVDCHHRSLLVFSSFSSYTLYEYAGPPNMGRRRLCPYLSLSAGLLVEGLMCSSNSSQTDEGPWAASCFLRGCQGCVGRSGKRVCLMQEEHGVNQ